jgi:rhamnose transport system permease protein
VAVVGLPSLVVTLAGLIAFRGMAYILIEDRSIGNFPEWFDFLGQKPVVGLIPLALIVYVVLLAVAIVVLHRTGFGRTTYVIGANRNVALFSGVRIARHTLTIFMMSGLMAAIAGVQYAAHLGAVRGSTAIGFELDIITIVLLGGVSIFGGTGSMVGVVLSTLLVLNLRNGLQLATMPGHTQTGVVGLLLIGSVLIPNLVSRAQEHRRRREAERASVVAAQGIPEGS